MNRPILHKLALTFFAIGIASVANVQPAEAASKVTACAVFSNGAAAGTVQMRLFSYDGVRWTYIKGGKSNASGCVDFLYVPTNRYVAIQAQQSYSNGWATEVWRGDSRLSRIGANAEHLGNIVMNRISCSTPHGYC
jgi:hypothetical protein